MRRLYTIRLYRKHDMDLLSLRLRNVDLADAVHQALIAFIEGRDMILSLPHFKNYDCGEHISTASKTEKKLILDDDDDVDREIICMLERINEGSWNNFFKNILRMYLWHPYAENYVKSEADLKYFEEKTELYKKNKEKLVARRQITKKSRVKTTVSEKNNEKKYSNKSSSINFGETQHSQSFSHSNRYPTDIKNIDEDRMGKNGYPTEMPEKNPDWEIKQVEEIEDLTDELPSKSQNSVIPSFIQESEEKSTSQPYVEETAEEDDDMDDITQAFSELLI